MLYIKHTKKYGRGVYSRSSIKKGQLIESSPILLIPHDEFNSSSVLDLYVYKYDKNTAALALGFGSLFNHSDSPNIAYQVNYESNCIEFIAAKNIKAHSQLFIDYGYDVRYARERYRNSKKFQ